MAEKTEDNTLCKPTVEFLNTKELPWEEVGSGIGKTRVKTLADDPRTGDSTFILHFPYKYRTVTNEPVTHPFWEEILILDGDVTDLTLKETFGVNHYACRPPGMKHGPYTVNNPKGCTMYVTNRYE